MKFIFFILLSSINVIYSIKKITLPNKIASYLVSHDRKNIWVGTHSGQVFKVDPKTNNLQCFDQNTFLSCNTSGKIIEFENSISTLIQSPNSVNFVLACGNRYFASDFGYRCTLHDKNNIMLFEKLPNQNNENIFSSNQTSMLFYSNAPNGLNLTEDMVLFVAKSLRSQSYKQNLAQSIFLSSRKEVSDYDKKKSPKTNSFLESLVHSSFPQLSRSQGLKLNYTYTYNDGYSFTAMGLAPNYVPKVDIKFIYGFSHERFAYALYMQKSVSDNQGSHIYQTRLIRICQDDLSFSSYTEVPLTCYFGSHHVPYNLAKTAFFGKDSHGSHVLYIAMNTNYPNVESSEANLSLGTVLCMFPMSEIMSAFTQAIKECYNGYGFHIPWLVGIQEQCVKDTSAQINDSFCGSPSNYPIQAQNELFVQTPYYIKGLTVNSLSIQNNHDKAVNKMVGFIGTTNGLIIKFVLDQDAITFVWAYDTVTSTQIPNPNHLNQQTLMHQNLMQTVQNDDSFILPLPLTPAVLPMTQHSFVEQNQDYYFASQKTPPKISMLVLASNKHLLLIPTNSCSIYGTSCQQCIQSHVLDPLECGWCTTLTQNTINTEKGQCMTQNECKNRGHIHDVKYNTIGTNRFDKHISIAQSSESTIYQWETQNCKPIIKKVWPLNGPIQGGTEIYIYGDSFHTSFDSYQNIKDKNTELLNVYLSPTMAQPINNNIETDCEKCQISFINDTIIKCKVPPLFKLQTKLRPSNNNNDVNSVTKFYITLKEERGQTKSLTKYATIPFEYKEVQIYEYEPHMGLSGSNIIRLYGKNLDVGSNVTVSVSRDKSLYVCEIVNQTSKLIICHLKLPEKTIYINPLTFEISLIIDNLITHVTPNFKVLPVPNLITLTPTKCIMSGVCALTLSINDIQSTDMDTWLEWQNLLNVSLIVHKNDVELLYGPLKEFHSMYDNEIHILINTNGSFCKKQDNTHSLLCTIVIPNITSHLTNFMTAKVLTSKSTDGFLLKNGNLITATTSSVSLIMAKISVHFNQIISIFVQSFVLYKDPVYYSFPLTPYRLNGTTNELTIRGERLDLVHTPQNIKILVGKQYVCVIHKFNSNYLTCHVIHINHLANQSFAAPTTLVTNSIKHNVETKEQLPYGKLKQNDLSVYVGTHFLEHNMQNGQNINDGRRVKREPLHQTKKESAHEVLVMAGPLTFSLGMVWFDPAQITGYYQRNEKDTLSNLGDVVELHTADISDNSSSKQFAIDVRANFVWAILAISILACFIVCFLVCAWWKRYKNMKLREALRLTPKYMQSFPYISSTAQNNKLNNRFPWLSECDNNNTCSSSSVTMINNINNHNIVTCFDSEDSLNTNLDDKSNIKYLPQTLNEPTNQSCMHESTSNMTNNKSSHPSRKSKKTTLSSNLKPFVFGKTAAQNYPALLLESDFIYRQQYSVNNMVSSINTKNTPSTKSGLLHKISSNVSRWQLKPPKPGVAFGQTNVLESYSDNNNNKKRKSAGNGNGPTLPANLLRDFDEETRSLLQDPNMLIPPDRLQIGPLIGQGNFGRVYKGFYFYYPNSSCGTSNMTSVAENSNNENVAKQSKNTPVKQDCVDVAIKTLNTTLARPEDLRSFLHEGLRMKEFSHPHVMSLIGISWGGPHNHKAAFAFDGAASDKTSTLTLGNLRSLLFPNKLTDALRTANNNPYEYLQQPLVILPYMANGDMLSYLRNPGVNPTLGNLLTWAHQIADGMTYLSKLKFVHRDLAARNCMLNQDYCAVVSDFGLSRDIYEKDYYSCSNKAVRLPIKWMALESLIKNIYNAKTDVWSFGIVLWELMTRGINPYPDVNNWDILTYLSCGRRLLQPLYCPDNLYQLMLSCWMSDPAERPTFESIMEEIQSIIEELASESIKDITYHYDTAYYICNNNNELIDDKHSAETVVSPSNETITNKDNTKLGQISSEITKERQKRDTVSVWDC